MCVLYNEDSLPTWPTITTGGVPGIFCEGEHNVDMRSRDTYLLRSNYVSIVSYPENRRGIYMQLLIV